MNSKSKVITTIGIIVIISLLLILILLRSQLFRLNTQNNQVFQSSINTPVATIIPRKKVTEEPKKQIYPLLNTNPAHESIHVPRKTEITINLGTNDWLLKDIDFSIIPPTQFLLKKDNQNLIVSFADQLEPGTMYTYQIKSHIFPDGLSPTYSFTTEGEKEGYQYDTGIASKWEEENQEARRERIDVYVSNILDMVPPDLIARSEYRSEVNNGSGGYVIIVSSDKKPEDTQKNFEDWLKNQGLTSEEISKIPIEYYEKGQEPTLRPTSTPYVLPTEYRSFSTGIFEDNNVISPTITSMNIDSKEPNVQLNTTLQILIQFIDLFSSGITIPTGGADYILTPYPSLSYMPKPLESITPYIIPSAGENVQKVVSLAQAIISNCYAPDDEGIYMRGRVRTRNHQCLNIIPNVRVQASMRVFLNHYEYMQCVNFIHGVHNLLYGRPLENNRSSNNAVDFSILVPNGYRFIYKNNPIIPIHPGTIAIWNYFVTDKNGSKVNVGHIAYVTQVFNEKTFDFEVADTNSKGKGVTAIQKKYDRPNFKGWLVKIN